MAFNSQATKPPPPPPPPLPTWRDSFEDDDDDEVIDTSHMTQEEKNEVRAQRKIRKMNREKQKRSKLNDQFDHLCQMLQMGRATRVEKLVVLNQTIRVVSQLKEENARLKQQRTHMKELLQQSQQQCSETPAKLLEAQQAQASKLTLPVMKDDKYDHHQPPQEEDFSWTLPPSHVDDLDFAFGWLGAQQQMMSIDSYAERDFKPCLLPKPDALDGVDMFLASSDDPSDLLC